MNDPQHTPAPKNRPLTRLEIESARLRKIRLNQPEVTYEEALAQFRSVEQAARESKFRWKT
jgi:hypothetical protein